MSRPAPAAAAAAAAATSACPICCRPFASSALAAHAAQRFDTIAAQYAAALPSVKRTLSMHLQQAVIEASKLTASAADLSAPALPLLPQHRKSNVNEARQLPVARANQFKQTTATSETAPSSFSQRKYVQPRWSSSLVSPSPASPPSPLLQQPLLSFGYASQASASYSNSKAATFSSELSKLAIVPLAAAAARTGTVDEVQKQTQAASSLAVIHKAQAQARAAPLLSQQLPVAAAEAAAVRSGATDAGRQLLTATSSSCQLVAVGNAAVPITPLSLSCPSAGTKLSELSEHGTRLLQFVGECHSLSSAADLFSVQLRAAEQAHPALVRTLRHQLQIPLDFWKASACRWSCSSAELVSALQLMLFLTDLEHLARETCANVVWRRLIVAPLPAAGGDPCSVSSSVEKWMFKIVATCFETKGRSHGSHA